MLKELIEENQLVITQIGSDNGNNYLRLICINSQGEVSYNSNLPDYLEGIIETLTYFRSGEEVCIKTFGPSGEFNERVSLEKIDNFFLSQ